MHKELVSIQLIKNYLVASKILTESSKDINKIYGFFHYLISQENNKKFNSLYIFNYINQFVVSDDVAKRKTSARVVEDLFAILFGGIVTDTEERKNLSIEVPAYFNLCKDKIASNKREKVDLLIDASYGISVKTLVQSNNELNLGALEKKVLFDNFGIGQYLQERTSTENIGLGSKPQLTNLLNLLRENGHYQDFSDRFKKMYEFIFADDIIIGIKNNPKFILYFFKGSEFTSFLNNRVDDIDSFMEVLNRWEGNSIRIDRTKLLESCTRKITIDLSVINDTVIPRINELDYKLHQNFIKYFNVHDNAGLKGELINLLESLFLSFDKDMTSLKMNSK